MAEQRRRSLHQGGNAKFYIEARVICTPVRHRAALIREQLAPQPARMEEGKRTHCRTACDWDEVGMR
jgi:hypothetical protein